MFKVTIYGGKANVDAALKVIDEALFNQKITLRKRDRCFTACFDFVEFIGQQMGDVDRV